MSEDSFTEVTEESWFGRMGNAFKGFVAGLVLFLVSFVVLFWNEGRAVRRYEDLQEGKGKVQTVKDISSVNSKYEGKLIHMSGDAETKEVLKDDQFGISQNALILRRSAQMYQWKENKETKTKKKVGGGTTKTTTYTYEKVWADKLIKSGTFKKKAGHDNPSSMKYSGQDFRARDVTFGAFKLTNAIIDKIGNYENLSISELPAAAKLKNAKLDNGLLYFGADPGNAQIGDIKISYKVIKPQVISIIANQINKTFEAAAMKNGTLLLVSAGTKSAESMFKAAEEANVMMTWILRLVGIIMMYAGLMMMLKPISVVMDVLPILGNIAEMGLGIICFLITLALSLLTIAIAWLFYRPLIAIPLLIIVGGAVFGIFYLKKKKAAAA